MTNDQPARRIVVIVLDDVNIPSYSTLVARRIAHDVVDRLGPDDLAGVTFTEYGKRQDLTKDRSRLNAAIDSVFPHWPVGGFSLPCALRSKFRSRYACVIDTFITAGSALVSAPQTRKTLVYISTGVPFDFSMSDLRGGGPPPGEEALSIQTIMKAMHQANVNIYAIDPSGAGSA